MIASIPWKFCLAASLAVLGAVPALAAPHALLSQSNGHIASAATRAVAAAPLSASTTLHLNLALPLRNQPELDQLLHDLYDPKSPLYGHYLTNTQFAARFSPTEADYQALADYAKAQGMTVTQKSSNRAVLSVDATSATAERAFHVHELLYQRPNGAKFYGPDRPPAIDADCPVNVLCVGGLDNANPLHYLPTSPEAAQAAAKPRASVVSHAATGNRGSYSPSDIRKAYDIPSTLTGAGVTMGVFQFAGYIPTDITSYEDGYNLTHVPLENVYMDSKTVSNQGQSGETTLDIEMEIAMAPKAAKEIVYIGDSGLSVANRIAAENRAKVVSCSLGWSSGTESAEDQAYKQMAAQGQSFFVASGDSGAFVDDRLSQIPQDDPWAIGVGGTILHTATDGFLLSDPAWVGSGGGVSTFWSLPSYQKTVSMATNGGSTTMRNSPDVSLNIDNYSIFNNGIWDGSGGTSASSPIWAGIAALINQQRAANGLGPVGFLNPAVYAIGQGPFYANDFHDMTSGNNGNSTASYNAVPGFDLVVGWGTPIVANLLTDLAGGTTPDYRLSSTPVTVPQGGSGTSTITVSGLNGFTSNVSLTLSTPPYGVTASLSAASTANTSTLTVTAGLTTPPGTVLIRVGSGSGSLFHVTYVPVTIKPTNGAITPVNLSGQYNVNGINSDGASFSTGGFDTDGYAYSSTLLGPSVVWSGMAFGFGPADTLDTVMAAVVPLPAGSYAKFDLLAAAVNGNQTAQTFKVTYTDNTSDTFTQDMSDWTGPANFPGEAIVAGPLAYRNSSDGTRDGAHPYIYGYSFPLNPAKTVQTIAMPGNRNVVIFAMSLIKPAAAPTYSLSASPSNLTVARGSSAASTIAVVSTDGFSGSVGLTASGLPAGVTASFSPVSTTGTSVLTLTASASATFGSATVTVTGTSGSVTHTATIALTVTAPAAASLTSLYPNSVQAGQNDFTFVVNGAGFSSNAQVVFIGVYLTTKFVSSTQLIATVPRGYLTTPETANITVVNPGARASGALPFTVTGPALVARCAPTTIQAGHVAFSMSIMGSGFTSSTRIFWNGNALPIYTLASGQIVTAIPASYVANATTATITITPATSANPPISFPVTPGLTFTGMSPATIQTGHADFTLTVTGTKFAIGAQISWAGAALTTTYVSPTQLTATIPAASVASSGTANVLVTNPGVAPTAPRTFTITP